MIQPVWDFISNIPLGLYGFSIGNRSGLWDVRSDEESSYAELSE